MEKVNSPSLMVDSWSWIIILPALMVDCIKVIGLMIKSMDMDNNIWLTEILMTGNSNKVKEMEKVDIITLMVDFIMVIGLMIKNMVMDIKNWLRRMFLKGNSNKIKKME